MNKAKRLLVPYAFIALVWVIPVGQVFFHNSAMNIVQDYLLGTGPSQLWFLLMLFGVFAISWWFTNIIHNSVCSSILISCCFLAIGLIGSHFVQNYFMVWTACLYLPFFIFGMKLRDMHERGVFLVLKTPLIILLALADILLFVVQQHIVGKNRALFTIINIPVELSLHLLGAFVAFYALQSLAVRIQWKDSKQFMNLSRISMIVYLLHQQLIYITIALFNGMCSAYLNMAINFVVALLGSLLIATLLMSNRFTRFLVGEK